MVGETLSLGVGADEAYAWQVVDFGQTQSDIHRVETFGGGALRVGDVEEVAVHVPVEAVGPGLVFHHGQVGPCRPVGHGELGLAPVVVDARPYVARFEGSGVEGLAVEHEGGHLCVHLAREQLESGTGEGSLTHVGGAGGCGAVGHQGQVATQRGLVAVHAQGVALGQGGDVERVAVGEPMERRAVAVDGGEALFLAHHDGVGQGHR